MAIAVSYSSSLRLSLSFKAEITGQAQEYIWDFGDGVKVTNRFDVAHTYVLMAISP